jgi:hypothetical protein
MVASSGSSITTPVSVPNGGTGAASLTAYTPVCGGTTATNPVQPVASTGTANMPLLSGGAAALPVFAPYAPPLAALTDAATVTVDASLGTLRTLLTTSGVGASRTMGVPSNPVDGQPLLFEVKQAASGGPYTVTWSSAAGGYSFGAGSAPTLSTAANATDFVSFRYSSRVAKWCFMGSELGY